MKRREKSFFQFPLCALAFGTSTRERFNVIPGYATVSKGRVLWSKLSESEREEHRAGWRDLPSIPGCHVSNPLHCAARHAADVIGVTCPSIPTVLAHYKALNEFCEAFVARHGRDAEVRIRRKLLFEARDGGGISPAEFAVLAAVYSVIGCKSRPVRITQETLRRRALGYRSAVIAEQEMGLRTDGAQPLTSWCLRRLIDALHERKFFARMTYGRRITYYSNRMTLKKMRESIVEHHTRRAGFRAVRRLEDEELTRTIRNQRAIFAGRRPRDDLNQHPTVPERAPWEHPEDYGDGE